MRTGVRGRDHASSLELRACVRRADRARRPHLTVCRCRRRPPGRGGHARRRAAMDRRLPQPARSGRGAHRHEGAEPARRAAGFRYRRGLCGLPGRRAGRTPGRGRGPDRQSAARFGGGGPMADGAGHRLFGAAGLEGAARQVRPPHAEPPGDDRPLSRRHAAGARRGAARDPEAGADGHREELFRQQRAQAQRAHLRQQPRAPRYAVGHVFRDRQLPAGSAHHRDAAVVARRRTASRSSRWAAWPSTRW